MRTNNSKELYHYGVLGMKWGRRKRTYNVSKDSKRTQGLRKKHISEMSNQDLQDVNRRLELERNYKNLTTKKNIGEKAVKTFTGIATTIVAIEAAAKTYEKIGKVAVNKLGKTVVK